MVNPAGAMVATLVASTYPNQAGEDSADIPGGKHFTKTLPAEMLDMGMEDSLHRAAEEQRTVEAPIRGRSIWINHLMTRRQKKP